MTIKTSIAIFMIMSLNFNVFADQQSPNSVESIIDSLQEWGKDPAIVEFVKQHNKQGLTLLSIKQRDQQWKSANGITQLMKELMQNKAAKRLIELEKTKPYFVELFLMGDKGENIAMTNKTTDYWQGDEDKFKYSFNQGKGDVYIGDVAFDESAKAYLIQVSVPVLDQEKAIGAITVGLSVDKIQ
ncbi:PDC sensor domain-containing protein [Spartinivicinus ruber]|uniref:PDC sensor domain-containing protein n=1 Tax=Spartinivicinus ruber TaxID=2683272 RepID=UPI001CA46408|nr:PDC sensor domain-containing protein [Spartinivicinus ruber]